jgi:aspartyl/asparaginyl beta-hydroxylase (cupin superfamily)
MNHNSDVKVTREERMELEDSEQRESEYWTERRAMEVRHSCPNCCECVEEDDEYCFNCGVSLI